MLKNAMPVSSQPPHTTTAWCSSAIGQRRRLRSTRNTTLNRPKGSNQLSSLLSAPVSNRIGPGCPVLKAPPPPPPKPPGPCDGKPPFCPCGRELPSCPWGGKTPFVPG